MTTLRTAVLTDAAANFAGAALAASGPQVWGLLGLPEAARRPSAVALLASGLWHAGTAAKSTPTPAQARVGAAINAGWVVAGVATQWLPLNGWQRTALLTVASYDATMTVLKTRT